MSPKIDVKDIAVSIRTSKDDNDYFSLTDMAKWRGDQTGVIIANWLSTKYTLEFLGIWEKMHNPSFNVMEFHNIKNEAGSNGFIISSSLWIRSTSAIGIQSSSGRYGGTFAHRDIALEFASWLSPEFKLYLIKEFQRLKELEKRTVFSLEWQVKRSLVKTNYKIHTDAIKKQLKQLSLSKFQEMLRYVDEADMLNLIMFGKTAKEWEKENPKLAKQGLNMRDVADIEDLIVLSGLETLNAYLLRQGERKEVRVKKLVAEAKKNLQIIQKRKSVEEIKKLTRPRLK